MISESAAGVRLAFQVSPELCAETDEAEFCAFGNLSVKLVDSVLRVQLDKRTHKETVKTYRSVPMDNFSEYEVGLCRFSHYGADHCGIGVQVLLAFDMNEERLIEIETKLAHQEVLMSDLNQVIARQQETISGLQTALKKFFKQYRDKHGDGEVGPADQKPPHY